MEKREIINVPIDMIQTNPFQPREVFKDEELVELSNSIKAHGIIQPVILRKLKDGYQLIAGERRMRAARIAGVSELPGFVLDIDGIDVAEISLIENLQRQDLNCIEEAKAYNVFVSKFGLTQEEIAAKVGMSRSRVANSLRLLALPEKIKAALSEEKISEGHGKALLGLPNGEVQEEAMKRVIEGNLSVRQTEMLVRNLLIDSPKKKRRKVTMTAIYVDARIYYNAVKKVIKEIKDNGGRADIIERETEDFMEIVIRIPKGDEIEEVVN
jgi:ParB family transcriptional regulator, chromosome partitioning protein